MSPVALGEGTGAVAGAIEDAPAVAVASSLRAVWPRLERAWRTSLPGVTTRPSFGASRTLARQIARGAPFELFLAADEASVTDLPHSAVVPGTGAVYARGRLALVMRGGADTGEDVPALARLVSRLAAEPGARVAIPNPTHAPYGVAAREALGTAGRWPLEAARLVVGENAAQTLQFLRAGAVEAALVPLSLVRDAKPAGSSVAVLDECLHAPLVHRLTALDGASPATIALARWFTGETARAVLAEAGFGVPP